MCTQVPSLYYQHISKRVVCHSWIVPTKWINKVVCPSPTCKFLIVPKTNDLNIVMTDGTPGKNLRDITCSGRWTYDSVISCVLRLFRVLSFSIIQSLPSGTTLKVHTRTRYCTENVFKKFLSYLC